MTLKFGAETLNPSVSYTGKLDKQQARWDVRETRSVFKLCREAWSQGRFTKNSGEKLNFFY